jgi:hypothetical protein
VLLAPEQDTVDLSSFVGRFQRSSRNGRTRKSAFNLIQIFRWAAEQNTVANVLVRYSKTFCCAQNKSIGVAFVDNSKIFAAVASKDVC